MDGEEEFILDRILAEKVHEGQTVYLVKWQSYDWFEWSWEPKDCFNDDGTIETWNARQKQEQEGQRKPYDHEDFDCRAAAHWSGQDYGAPEPPEPEPEPQPEPQDDVGCLGIVDDAGAGQHEGPNAAGAVKPPAVRERLGPITTSEADLADPSRTVPSDLNSAELAIRSSPVTSVPTRPAGSQAQDSRQTVKPNSTSDKRPPVSRLPGPKRARKSSKTFQSQPLDSSVLKRSADARGIFDNWDTNRRKRPATASSRAAKPFRNFSTLRRAELSGRNEPAPDLQSLTLFNPRDGAVVKDSTTAPNLQEAQGRSLPTSPVKAKQALPLDTPAPVSAIQQPQNNTAQGDTHAAEDGLFLTESPPQELPASRPGSSGWGAGAEPPHFPHHTEHFNRRNSAGGDRRDKPDRPPPPRSLSSPQVIGASPPKRRLFGDTVPAKARRRSIPGERPELPEMDFGPPDSLSCDFEHISGNGGLYPHRPEVSNPRTVIFGNLVAGENRDLDVRVKFSGVPLHLKHLFLRIKKPPRDVSVWVTKSCSAPEWQGYYHQQGQGYYGAGHIESYPESHEALVELAQALRTSAIGSIFFAESYTLLVYPTGTSEWSFIDDRFSVSSSYELLRFVFRTPVRPRQAAPETGARTPLHLRTSLSCPTTPVEGPLQRPLSPGVDIHSVIMSSKTDKGKMQARAWIESMYPPPTKENQNVKFFLFFPLEQKREHDIMEDCLRTCAGVKVYGCFENGEWDYFCERARRGVVILHHSLTDYEKIPHFRKVLRNGLIKIVSLDLSAKKGKGSEHLSQKIFPSGCATLLLESLFVEEPKSVKRLFQWYKRCIMSTKDPRTWKLVARPRLKPWLKKQIQGPAAAERAEDFWGVFEEYLKVVPASDEDGADRHETPTADSPLITPATMNSYHYDLVKESAGSEQLLSNDDLLVKWFGEWTLTQTRRHRRFYIVYPSSPEAGTRARKWANEWQHISVLNMEQFNLTEHVDSSLAAYEKRKAGEGKAKAVKSPEG